MKDQPSTSQCKLFKTEDYWAIWLGLGIIAVAMLTFWLGGSIKSFVVIPGAWSTFAKVGEDLSKNFIAYLVLFLGFGAVFTFSIWMMGRSIKEFIAGYFIVFLGSLAIFYLAGWEFMKKWDLGAPLLALLIGLVIGNIIRMPKWFNTAMRTEYYIKTGIVLLGATLPLTLIFQAGGIAFLQATIVSVGTWLTIFLAATRIFKLDPRFGAVLGAGGAVCGVSGSIAIGGAVRADKDHIAIGIGVVSVWAIAMIISLTIVTKFIVPPPGTPVTPTDPWYIITPGEAGAWVGTSEYADAAGFAVVAELAQRYGEAPIHAFTLMKVIGRDIWVGLWAFILSIVSVMFWEKGDKGDKGGTVGFSVIWERFPKFVLGFFAACVLVSIIAGLAPKDYVGKAKTDDVFKTHSKKYEYHADFLAYQVPAELAQKFQYDAQAGEILFHGRMNTDEFKLLAAKAETQDQRWALQNLQAKSDWFGSVVTDKAVGPIKKLRDWTFVFCFLCIGLSTRFKDLATFGMKPFWAFAIGVIVNVPLGFFLTSVVFKNYWAAIGH